jgi:hypothetical protein
MLIATRDRVAHSIRKKKKKKKQKKKKRKGIYKE